MPQCHAVLLFNSVGKGVITDEYVRDVVKRSRSKVARVSQCTDEPTEKVAGAVAASTPADKEDMNRETEKRYSKPCRMILHGINSSGSSAPRASLIMSIEELYHIRKQWRRTATRQPDETGDALGKLDLDAIKNMASQGRCPILLRQGTCHPWTPTDRWDVLDDDKYMATLEVDYLRFIAGYRGCDRKSRLLG